MSNWNNQISRLTVFIVLLAVFLAACDGSPGNRDSNPFHLPPEGFIGDVEKGAVLYAQNCLSCHGPEGTGSGQGPPLVHRTYNPSHHADLAFHLAVKNGVRRHHWQFGDMPPLPEISPESVGHIVVYIRDRQKRAGIE